MPTDVKEKIVYTFRSVHESTLILEKMNDIVIRKGCVSVNELCVLCGMLTRYENEKVGWESLVGTTIRQTSNNNFSIIFPETKELT